MALGLMAGELGCTEQTTLPLVPPAGQPAVKITKEPDLPKRKPQPSTCVAFGNASEGAAADPKRSLAEQEHLHDQARKFYQQALQIEPNNLEALTALARLYNTTGDHARAVATYQKAVQTHPQQASLWYELGLCHARSKEWEPAVGGLRQAAKLDPEEKLYSRALGFCLARARRYDESLSVFAKADGEAAAHYNLARMLHHMKEDELSLNHVRMALAITPELAGGRGLLAALETPSGTNVKSSLPAGPEEIGSESSRLKDSAQNAALEAAESEASPPSDSANSAGPDISASEAPQPADSAKQGETSAK
jgi:tetratricopeptide (TPR) repeat protein